MLKLQLTFSSFAKSDTLNVADNEEKIIMITSEQAFNFIDKKGEQDIDRSYCNTFMIINVISNFYLERK